MNGGNAYSLCRSQAHARADLTDWPPLPKLLSPWLTSGSPGERYTEKIRESRTGWSSELAPCGSPCWQLAPTVLPGDHLVTQPISDMPSDRFPLDPSYVLRMAPSLSSPSDDPVVTFQNQFWDLSDSLTTVSSTTR